MLHNAKTIAIVGLSKNELRASYFVGYYLSATATASFRSTRARPKSSARRASRASLDVPVPVDIVNVFRAPDALPAIAAEAVEIGARNLWCQFSVINEEGARIAEAGGLSVVMDRCIKVEHARYVGTDALARLQHPAHHIRARRPSVGIHVSGSGFRFRVQTFMVRANP